MRPGGRGVVGLLRCVIPAVDTAPGMTREWQSRDGRVTVGVGRSPIGVRTVPRGDHLARSELHWKRVQDKVGPRSYYGI